MGNNWIDWWKTENITREINWHKNMETFIRSTYTIMNYSVEDVILDIGCGPGFLADFLKNNVKEIHCLDISEANLKICSQKFSDDRNIFLYEIPDTDYTNLSFLRGKKFSKIICLSVIQYYKSKSEVENLIKEVKKITLPGSQFLIADILTRNHMISQLYGLIKTGIKDRYLIESLKLLYRARTSSYHEIHSSNGLLSYSLDELQDLIRKLDLNAKILKTQMTVNANRLHLLIQF